MAYSTLLSLEYAINQILDPNQFSVSPPEKKLIITLDKFVCFFQSFLEDFPENATILEARIRDVATEAEDIIEWFSWKEIRNSYRYIKRISVVRHIKFKYQLQKVREKMDKIAAEVVEIHNSIKIKDKQLGDFVGASSSTQVADAGKVNMVGFNEDLIQMKERLCGRVTQLQILPIFGMGGIGRTTLARNAYDDQLIVEHFHIRVWVAVSQDYNERRILLDLIDSMKGFDIEYTTKKSQQGNESLAKIPELSNSEIALKVHKILIGRRFLIVMDDIWSTEVLDDVKKLFPSDNNGSRILLTTRLKEVATYANSTTLSHEMRLMDADQSWNLLRQKVFMHQDRIPHQLESIGREIARSCGGLPLAIVVIAGLLSTTSKTVTSWKKIAKNIRSSLAIEDFQIEKILSLSYNHLPHHLRPCFLYMAGFPEDQEIKVTRLIRLWVAESFVKPVASREFEDTAEKYLEDLVDRSLIIVTKRKSNGKIKCCNLHDIVREMCIKLSEEEKFLMHVKDIELLNSMKDLRRISISHSDLNSTSIIYTSSIRTVMYFQDEIYYFRSFRLVRVLDLLKSKLRYLCPPDLFVQLFHLRYLACGGFWGISRAISHLQRLQTLIIRNTDQNYFPYELWKMLQLRHLRINDSIHLPDTNAATSALENLQTLGKVEDLKCSINTLKLIPNLTKLWLTYTFRGSEELLFHNLVYLSRLEKLHLEVECNLDDSRKPNLIVPISLKKLTLIGWGARGPYINIASCPNLEVLKLKEFDFEEQAWRTTAEDFPKLKFLHIKNSDLRHWETESSHFPRLKTLQVHSCYDLSEIPDCIGEIPTLELIELKLCTNSLVESVKRIHEEAESYGDDVFEVHFLGGKVEQSPESTGRRWL